MPTILAQVALQGTSNLAEDRYVNTFHFTQPLPFTDPDYGAIYTALVDFYNAIPPGATEPVASWIGPSVSRSPMIHTIKMYPVGGIPPTPPVSSSFFSLGPAGNLLQDLPTEVAVCLSYYAGINAKRRRGRIYIGPLIDDAMTGGANPRPAVSMRDTLSEAGKALAGQIGTAAWRWAVYSAMDAVAREITAGWVDNAFDTQRRRGIKTTDRQVWNAT